ncbi:MAG: DUF2442 domain-containing protein [Xanthobacteraceae bacterium]
MDQREYELANRLGKLRQATEPMARSARFDRKAGEIVVTLNTGVFSFRPECLPALAKATPDELDEIEISPSGFGLLFPRLDEGFSVPALVREFATGESQSPADPSTGSELGRSE